MSFFRYAFQFFTAARRRRHAAAERHAIISFQLSAIFHSFDFSDPPRHFATLPRYTD